MLDSNRYAHLIGSHLLPERFWAKVDVDDSGCWLWTATTTQGYGYLWAPPGTVSTRAHRLAYEALVGHVPVELVLDHLCRIRRCVNPAHLEPVTHQVNLLRGETRAAAGAAQTHCAKGRHEFTPANTFIQQGKRRCRTCHNKRTKMYKRARKAALTSAA